MTSPYTTQTCAQSLTEHILPLQK